MDSEPDQQGGRTTPLRLGASKNEQRTLQSTANPQPFACQCYERTV